MRDKGNNRRAAAYVEGFNAGLRDGRNKARAEAIITKDANSRGDYERGWQDGKGVTTHLENRINTLLETNEKLKQTINQHVEDTIATGEYIARLERMVQTQAVFIDALPKEPA